MSFYIIFISFFLISIHCEAQIKTPDGRYKVLANVVNGDTIPLINLAPAEVFASLSPLAAANMKAYLKLRRDVLRAYPYARLAATQLKFINDSVAHISGERNKKKFIKKLEKELKNQFETVVLYLNRIEPLSNHIGHMINRSSIQQGKDGAI